MDWKQLKFWTRPTVIENTGPFTLPETIIEVQPQFVTGVRLVKRKPRARPAFGGRGGEGTTRQVHQIAVGRLEPGTLRPAVHAPNVADPEDLSRKLEGIAAFLRSRSGRWGTTGLLVPDAVVRVTTLTFETLPEAPREAQGLVRWRIRENLPFPAEEARVSYQVTYRDSQRIEVLAVAASNEVMGEYESAVAAVNGDCTLILPSTLAMLPLLPDTDETSGQLIIHWCSGFLTTAVVAGQRLCLWRTRALEVDETSEAVAEASRALASAEDRFQLQVAGVWLCARPPEMNRISADLTLALQRDVRPLTPSVGMASALLAADERALFEGFGAPAAALAANGVGIGINGNSEFSPAALSPEP